MMFSNLLQVALIVFGLVTLTVAHMEMVQPPPRHSRYNPTWTGTPDYNMVNPLGIYPCKGYEQGGIVQTVQAGGSVQVKIGGGATHGGGHCQFAISYDKGQTFAVLETIYNNCLIASTEYSVNIPSTAGSSKNVVFAWTWINKIGNREYYMNCADLEIQGTTNGYITGPKLLVANLQGYPTIPEFSGDGPNDGRDLLAARPIITIRPGNDPAPTSTTKPTSAAPTKTSSTTTNATSSPTSTPGACKDITAWSTGVAYNGSQKVTYKGHLWQARWWNQNEIPDNSSVWVDLGAC